MAGKTNSHSDSVLNVLKGTTLTGITQSHIGLFTVTPSDAGGGTESTYGSDTRQTIDFGALAAGSPSGRQLSNTPAVSWTSWNGTSPETFVAAGIFDLISAGELLYWGALTANRTINTGETATFAIGSVVITED